MELAKEGDIIEWSFPENHGGDLSGKSFQAEVAVVSHDDKEYFVNAEYGQDKIPFDGIKKIIKRKVVIDYEINFTYENAELKDIISLPNFNPITGSKGLTSVTEGKIFLKMFKGGIYPACSKHGAILKTSVYGDYWMWRCRELNCDEGCVIKK